VTELHPRAVKSNFEPAINPFNGWGISAEAYKTDSMIDFGGAGIVMGDVQHHTFLCQKQTVEISIRFEWLL
jgi:hypothetical protein